MQQQDRVIEVRAMRGPSGVLIDVDGPYADERGNRTHGIYWRDEAVHTALLMLAVASTTYDSATEFARVIDEARASIGLQDSSGPLQYQGSADSSAAARPQ